MPVPPPNPPPENLGRYSVVRRLGTGGMAEVFLAKSTGAEGIEKVLVVKRVLPSFARSPRFIAMFVDEAKVAMRLNHPNIVQVYAFEQVQGELVLAMEFVDGLDLGRLLTAARRQGRRIPYALSAFIVMELSKGLDYAHNRKDESGVPMEIVHRDVSPQNVLISYDGVVKIADFGIARARLVSEDTGVIKGKFSYMSPEQARGQRVDRRSDVYSLGVLLAELLMNRSMYPGQQGMEVLEQVREGKLTTPRQVDPNVPAELDEIVRRATAFDREERYQTGRSFAGAISRWLHAQEDLLDATDLERFIAETAPRELTSPDTTGGAPLARTQMSLPHTGRELRERRNVVVVHGKLWGGEEVDEPITGIERSASEIEGARSVRSVGAQAVRVLEDIAYKYHAILDWPQGQGRREFRFLLGVGRVSVDDPLHATRLALDVLEAFEGLSADRLAPLDASIGLSRGVVATARAPGGRLRYEPLEGVFEVARQLGEAGATGQVYASGEVFRLARRAFAFDEKDVREVDVSARAHRVRAYRLRGARTREERAAEALAVAGEVGLFGRSMEIQALVDTYEEVVRTEQSGYLALFGELGVGKSALVGAALGSFHPDPQLLRLECIFGASEVPYAAVAELVRDACAIDEDMSAEEIRERLAATLEGALPPELRSAARDALEPLVVPTSSAPDDTGDRSSALIRAVRHLLGGLAQQRPLVVWIDALQLVDTPSLQLMARLMSQSYEVPLMVVIGSRPDERVEAQLGGIPRIDLEELEDEERRALIAARFGDARVPTDIQQAIVHRAGGNPFFLIELVDALLDRGVLRVEGEGTEKRVVRRPGAAFALPTTLEDVIAARLGELPERERHALRWLAVAGPGMRAHELEALTGESLDAELAALEERGLVQRRVGGGLAFPSAVVRHVAYESIDSGDRVRMHRLVAHHLAQLDPPVPPARLAYHREQAGDRSGAAEAYLAAGHSAQAMYSHEDAMRFFGRVLALLPPDSPQAFDAHEAREHILRALGRRSEQRHELEALRAMAERSRDPRQIAVAFNRLARFDLDAARPTGVDAMLRRSLEAAIGSEDKTAEIEALRLLGQLRREQGDVMGAIEALDRALARAGVDPDLLSARGQTLVQKAILLWRAGRLEESLEASAEAVVIFRRLGLKGHEAHALSALGVALAHRGAFEDAIQVMRASILLDREAGDRLHLGRKVSNVGQLYAELGDFESGLAFMRRALDVFAVLDDQAGHTDTLCAIGELLAEQADDPEAAEATLAEARTLAERLHDPYDLAHVCLVESALELARGDAARAEGLARDAVSHARAAGAFGYEMLAMATRAEALAEIGEAEPARQLAREVQSAVAGRRHLERAERIHLRLATALELADEPELAARARADARAVVDSRLEQIRDERLRRRYLDSPMVKAVRSGG